MIAMISILYIGLILLIYKLLKIKPNPINIASMVVLGIVLIGGIVIQWTFSSPTANNLVVSRYTIQLVPQVKGPVSKIHARPNVPLKKGEDILFEIQPDSYEFVLDQASASLEAAVRNIDQLKAAIRGATAAVNKAGASLASAKAELDVAHETEKLNPDAISGLQVTQLAEQHNVALAVVDQAKAGEDQAKASLAVAQSKIVALTAQRANAQFNLDQCTVYAPADGFVTNWQVREGTMVVSLPLAPVGLYVDTSSVILAASFNQNVLVNVKPGDVAEISLRTKPGEVFLGKVDSIVQASGEGQFVTSGQLGSAGDLASKGMLVVKFVLDDEAVAKELAMGTAGTVVVYTGKGKPFHMISKVVVRINSWMYYLNPM